MRRRVKTLVLAAETVNTSPLLPAAAVLLILLFGVSLALAEPRDVPILTAQQITANPFDAGGGLTTGDFATGDLATGAMIIEDSPILSRPLHPPRYHDRYKFYHRYDHALRSRFNPIDDGVQ